MPPRHFYAIDLTTYSPDLHPPFTEGLIFRSPDAGDRSILAQLMLAAYSGTIDDDGGILGDAIVEVDNYLRGEYGTPLLESSQLAVDKKGRGASAVLVSRWGKQDLPLIAFMMTDPAWQGKGIGLSLLKGSMKALQESGERAVRAVITEGNLPSEKLFARAGFQRIEPTHGS